jgi:protocatechuate 3,4-dioxygenase beta subunit
LSKSPHRSFPFAWLVLLLTVLVVAFLALRRSPPPPEAGTAARPQRAPGAHTYVNRSLWRDPAPQGGAAAEVPQQGPTLSGYVYDMDGRPLSGAVVSATTFELAGNLPSLAGTVVSDAGGRFALHLPEGTYQVNASHKGYGPASATVRTGDPVSLVLPSSGVVTGRVLDEQRRPVERFTIDVISVVPGHMPAPAPLVSRAFESRDGTFRVEEFPAWAVVVKASAPGYASAFSQPLTLQEKDAKHIELTLPVGCTLTGRVEDPAGAPVPYVLVDAESRLVSGSMSELAMQSANQTQSGPDGAFRIEHVAVGTLHVRAYDGSHAVTTATVELPSCDKAPPVKIVLAQGGGVAGVARTSDGRPLDGARVSLSNRAIGFVAARTDELGRFRFDRIPPGLARMELHYKGQRTLLTLEIKDGEVVNRDLVLFARGRGELRGRISAGGRPIGGARLLLASGHGQSGVDTYYAVTDPDGRYRFADLPEGLYLLSVISTTKGQGIKIAAGGVASLDLDVKPQPEPAMSEEPEDEPETPASPAPKATPRVN